MFSKYFHRLRLWLEAYMIRRNTYNHIIGLEVSRFTRKEAEALKDHMHLFNKFLGNKLMVVNATTFWSNQDGYHVAKGRIEMLEELIRWGEKLQKTEVITDEVIPLVIPPKDPKLTPVH